MKTKKENKLRKIINLILNVLLIIFFIIVVYMILYKIFGNSPTDFQLILWIAGFLGTAILKLFNLVYGINREIGELNMGVINGFKKIKEDITNISNMFNKL